MTDDRLAALAAKAGLVWVRRGGLPTTDDVPIWFGWHDEAIHAVVGGPEQPDPFGELPAQMLVTVPSKDTGASVLCVAMTVALLPPGTAAWQAATDALKVLRLNAGGGVDLPEVWATQSTVVRFTPTGPSQPFDQDGDPGARPVSVEQVRPRRWRAMRAHARRR
jgi:hypothetical protein